MRWQSSAEFLESLLHEKPSDLSEHAVYQHGAACHLDLCCKTQQEHNWATCCQVSHASSRWAFQSSTSYWTVWAYCHQTPMFHFWKQCFRKDGPRSTTQSWQYNSGDRHNWINPVLPNCTIRYLKISCSISYRNLCTVSQPSWWHKHFSFNDPIIWRQESDERSSPDLVQPLPIILQMNLNKQKQNHANSWYNFL